MNDVVDNRRVTAESVQEVPADKVADTSTYAPFAPIMDRVQVRVIEEQVEENGVMMPPKYRQHSNKGIVVAVGQWVILGGKQIPLLDVIKPGDKVLFGEYNCEKFNGLDGQEYELVRVQDIRGVERLVEPTAPKMHYCNGNTSDPNTVIKTVLEPTDLDPDRLTKIAEAMREQDPEAGIVRMIVRQAPTQENSDNA